MRTIGWFGASILALAAFAGGWSLAARQASGVELRPGVTVFSEALSAHLAGTGVTVTVLCPGFTRTEFQQRAGLDVRRLPSVMWLDADALVRDCLHDVARGRVICIPSKRYRVMVGLLRLTPSRFLRGGGGEVTRRTRG